APEIHTRSLHDALPISVRQHLEFTARLYKVRDGAERNAQLLDALEMTEKAGALPTELSRGMKQKVALACGFLHQPRAMFFDEPRSEEHTSELQSLAYLV